MLDEQTKRELEGRYFPSLEQVVFGPLHQALAGEEFLGARVLDAGCGKGTWILRPYKQRFASVVGVDVDVPPDGETDAFSCARLESLPFRHDAFDLIVCYLVLEHVRDPERVFAELARVLRPGGTLLLKTPAAWAPTTCISRFTPHAAHRFLKALVGTQKTDVFPTYYRCNTISALRRLSEKSGFTCQQIMRIDQTYAYAGFARIPYILGLLYSRAVQHPWLGWLRNSLVGICRKDSKP